MEELAANLTYEEVQEIINDFPLLPSRNRMVITVNTEESDDLDLSGVGFSESQYVLAKGPHVWDEINLGDKVLLDLEKLSVQTSHDQYEIKIEPVKVNGKVYAFIYDSSIKAIDNR